MAVILQKQLDVWRLKSKSGENRLIPFISLAKIKRKHTCPLYDCIFLFILANEMKGINLFAPDLFFNLQTYSCFCKMTAMTHQQNQPLHLKYFSLLNSN